MRQLAVVLGLVSSLPSAVTASSGQAGDDGKPPERAKQLFAMSLADLLKVPIYVSAKVPEPHVLSSGSVTRYSAEQIRQYGYYTISELAQLTPGYALTTKVGEIGLATRGMAGTSFENNRHLLLIDGIPVRHARGARMQVSTAIPLHFADAVEFMRGPASALYGSGAMNGVVNVRLPKRDSSRAGLEARVELGSRDDTRRGMGNLWLNTKVGSTSVSLGGFNRENSGDLIDPTNPATPQWENDDEQKSRFVYARHHTQLGDGSATAGVLYSERLNGMGEVAQGRLIHLNNHTRWKTLLAYAKYERPVTDTVHVSAYTSYNRSQESGFYGYDNTSQRGETYRNTTQAYEFQAEVSFELGNKTDLIVGANVDLRRELGDPHSYFRTVSATGIATPAGRVFSKFAPWFKERAVFAQLRHRFDWLAGTHLTGGLRYTDIDAGGLRSDNLSPRLSVVQELSDAWVLKFLWHSAFRSPNIKEAGLNRQVSVRRGFPNLPLDPERFTTREISLGYARDNYVFEFNLFHSEIEGAILRRQIITRRAFFNAETDTTARGGELVGTWRINDGWEVSGNFSFNRPNGFDDARLRQILPRRSASLVLTRNSRFLGKPYTLSVINVWTGGYSSNTPANVVNDQLRTDVNFSYTPTKHVTVGFQARNLFDRTARIPVQDGVGLPLPGLEVSATVAVNLDLN